MARTLTIAVVGLLVAAALGWNAAEAHYQGCIAAVEAIPDTRSDIERRVGGFRGDDPYLVSVQRRLDGCSRIP